MSLPFSTMQQRLAYFNGALIAAEGFALPVTDAGFVLGATVTEQLRTFGGELFRLDDHWQRLAHSLEITGIKPRESLADLADIAQRLVRHNHALENPADDVGLSVFITPGPYAALSEGQAAPPTVGLHTYWLPFSLWHEKYERGVSLVTTEVRQVPAASWPAELKCRSRMHYFLADRAAAAIEPGARALLLDAEGYVTETATANVLAYFAGEGLVSPPHARILPGISVAVARQLAEELGIAFIERDLLPAELPSASEILITSTPNCLLPVTQFNGQPVGSGTPGPIFQQLLAAWSKHVGLDIAAQARRFVAR